jgi:transcriptional regulator with XRE-family HTH domain
VADSWGHTVSDRIDDEDRDEFDEFLAESLNDPGFRTAYEDAEARSRLLEGLVKIRRCLHLTQTEVAKRMQTTQSFVSEFENGGTDPHLSTLQRYARAVTARLHVKIEMPTDGPWMPTGQAAYTSGSRVTISIEQRVSPDSDFTSKWTEYGMKARGDRSTNAR